MMYKYIKFFMEINKLISLIEEKIKKNFKIDEINIEDKSFLHKKHKNFDEKKFHIKLTINSQELKKDSLLESNRKINKVLVNELKNYIHSIQIIIN